MPAYRRQLHHVSRLPRNACRAVPAGRWGRARDAFRAIPAVRCPKPAAGFLLRVTHAVVWETKYTRKGFARNEFSYF